MSLSRLDRTKTPFNMEKIPFIACRGIASRRVWLGHGVNLKLQNKLLKLTD